MAETATGKLEGIPFSISLGELELLVNRGSAEQLGNALTFLPGHRMVDLINHQIRNHNGRTLVHLAAQSGNYECLDLLLQAGGNKVKNARSFPADMRQTPLHLAAIGGYPKCIEVLLRHGANPYLRNDATELPLHLAAGKPTCERLLGKAYSKPTEPRNTNSKPTISPEPQNTNSKSSASPDPSSSHSSLELDNYLENIRKKIKESGSIVHRIGNLVFVGLPGSGKTILIDNLLELASEIHNSPSTGVMKGIITVNISEDHLSTIVVSPGVVSPGKHKWRKVNFETNFLKKFKGSVPPPPPPAEASGIGKIFNRLVQVFHRPARQPAPPPAEAHVQEQMMQAVTLVITEDNYKDICSELDNKCSLYLSDTGGQIEFQELLPLLVAGQSIFVFVFSLVNGLRVKVNISYRKKVANGDKIEHSNCYTTAIDVRESFLQSMSSIDSMCSFAKFRQCKLKPFVLIVGTHRDKLVDELGKDRAELRIAELDREIASLVEEHQYEHLVVLATKDRFMFAVDNTNPKDEAFDCIRSKVKELVDGNREFEVEFPLSYLAATLKLRRYKQPFIDRDEFTQDVAQFGIQPEDIDNLIQFLHSTIGLIQYFSVEGLKEIIVRNPQVLYDLVSFLIVQSFLPPTNVLSEYSDIQKGIYSKECLDRFISMFCRDISSNLIGVERLTMLLKELRIMAPFKDIDSDQQKFFLPCVLNHLSEHCKSISSSEIQPLAITFKCGHCPKGIFGVLVHYILDHERKSVHEIEWSVDKSQIFRDQISFHVGPHKEVAAPYKRDVIILKTSTTHLEVHCLPTANRDSTAIEVICHQVRSILIAGIEEALERLHYDKVKTTPHEALVCGKQNCLKVHEVIVSESRFINCENDSVPLPKSGLYWFATPPVISFPHGSPINLIKDRAGDVLFVVSPAPNPPLLEHGLLKDGKDVLDSRVSIRGCAVHFECVRQEDEGEYTIWLSNGIGVGEEKFNITVLPPLYYRFDDCITAEPGQLCTVTFTTDPPLPNAKHTIRSKKDGRQLMGKVDITSTTIVFHDLEVLDSGVYIISCHDDSGVEGEATFVLNVSESQNGNGKGVQHTALKPINVNRYLKLLDTPKLYELGGELGLNITELRKVPPQELPLVLAERWLKEEDTVRQTSGTPSWSSLIQALQTIGATGVADRIKLT